MKEKSKQTKTSTTSEQTRALPSNLTESCNRRYCPAIDTSVKLQRNIHREITSNKCKVNSSTSAIKSTNKITFYFLKKKKSNGFYSSCSDIENCSSL